MIDYKKKITLNKNIITTYKKLNDLNLNTICVEGNCPNIGECFSKGKMTFLILGDICTRNCLYCSVKKHRSGRELDFTTIDNIIKIIALNNLKSIVVTSVTRDDLDDGGSSYYVKLCEEVKSLKKDLFIEILTPDFGYKNCSIEMIVSSKADILSHNVELAKSIYRKYRPNGDYNKSLDILKIYSKSNKKSKSAFMIGLGESDYDIKQTIEDIANTGVDYLSIGQYIAPSKKHLKPVKYYSHYEFKILENWVIENFDFKKVDISFYSRSSYMDA